MVECLSPLQGGLHEDPQLADDALLADVVVESARSQGLFDAELVGLRSAGEDVSLAGHGAIIARVEPARDRADLVVRGDGDLAEIADAVLGLLATDD